MREEPFSAVLLAGGRSRRMGQDKALLQLHGEPLWQRQLRTLKESGAREVFIAGRADGPWAQAGVPVLGDAAPEAGPLGGLVAALEGMHTRWLLVLPVDVPLAHAGWLRQLVCLAQQGGAGLIPHDGQHLQPLVAVYPQMVAHLARKRLNREELGLQGLITEAETRGVLRTYLVPAAERPLLANANTPEEFRALGTDEARDSEAAR